MLCVVFAHRLDGLFFICHGSNGNRPFIFDASRKNKNGRKNGRITATVLDYYQNNAYFSARLIQVCATVSGFSDRLSIPCSMSQRAKSS
ncbi:hypothetical protein DBV23_17485 [Edwardsiella ictaluri]|nr:hypothetical protein DBV23_17485 [Edwardsiella ictaluri]WJH21123.1 hypothetical protein FGU63_08945 [Edwardsiella ictaluri]